MGFLGRSAADRDGRAATRTARATLSITAARSNVHATPLPAASPGPAVPALLSTSKITPERSPFNGRPAQSIPACSPPPEHCAAELSLPLTKSSARSARLWALYPGRAPTRPTTANPSNRRRRRTPLLLPSRPTDARVVPMGPCRRNRAGSKRAPERVAGTSLFAGCLAAPDWDSRRI